MSATEKSLIARFLGLGLSKKAAKRAAKTAIKNGKKTS